MEYVELHCHSNFSLLDGASHPEDLVARAVELDMPALGLTDHDAVYGVVRFVKAADVAGIHPIVGVELTIGEQPILSRGQAPRSTVGHLTLLVENEIGWGNLCRLISRARRDMPKGQAALLVDDLVGCIDGLIALSGCRKGEITAALLRRDWDGARDAARHYRDLFGGPERFWIELQHHLRPEDETLVAHLAGLAEHLGVGCVATNNVHYARRDSHRLQDVLVCIRHGTTLDKSHHLRRPNSEYYLKSGKQMAPLFTRYPEALANTSRIAERCRFDLRYGVQDLPPFPTEHGLEAQGYLRHLCEAALLARYASIPVEVVNRLNYELSVIERAGLSNYFLIVWDIARYAHEGGIRCQGRGSAANSLVAYLLDITPIDPLAHDLVFERFLSDERMLAPDIDIDFDAARREEVIQYIYERYGIEHAAMACTFVTFRARSAIRDVGKALGIPLYLVEQATKALDTYDPRDIGKSPGVQGFLSEQENALAWRQLFDLVRQIDGFPRHLGIHNGGMVITGPPLIERVPTEPAAMPGRVVVQWDKEALEDVGLVKIDLLGLRMLSALSEAADTIQQTTGKRVDLDALTFDDPVVYGLIARGDTVGVFQVESRAQAQMLPRLKPRCFADLIVAISLIRPGPIQGNMVHPYLRRRRGAEPVTYLHPLLEPILSETLGVVLFQEQVLQIARDVAGFSPGQGEVLRRGLGYKHGSEVITVLERAFIEGAGKCSVPAHTAQAIFDMLRAFGSYSLPKSHAAAFAVIVYRSAWLKRYHPAAFYAALLNHQPMGFWSPAVLVNDARRHGVDVLPVDVNASEGRTTLESGALRLGLCRVRGMGEANVERLVEARQAGAFTGLSDLCQRTRLPRRLIEHLILAGALDGWGIPRRSLLWELGRLHYQEEELELVFPDDSVELPPLSESEKLQLERGILGLSTGPHPMALIRAWLAQQSVLSSAEVRACSTGEQIRVAGLVVVHQAPPTAKGHHFITLEDEDGLLDVIVQPGVYERYRGIWRHSPVLVVEGVVQSQDGVVGLLALHVASVPLWDIGSGEDNPADDCVS